MGRSLERGLIAFISAAMLLNATACGTLMYPNRHGQRAGSIDPAVVLLDGALLLVFLVPGLVAYGIDFHTGAIYLPKRGRVSILHLPPKDVSAARVAKLVEAHTGAHVAPGDPRLEVRRLAKGANLEEVLLRLSPAFPSSG